MEPCTEVVLLRIVCLLGSLKVICSSDNFHFGIGWEKPMPQGYIMPESSSNPKLKRIASAYEDSEEKKSVPKEPIPIFEPNPPMKKVQFGFGIDGLLSWVKKSNSSKDGGSSSSGDDCDEDEELERIITWKLIARQMGDDVMSDRINNILKDALTNGLCSGKEDDDQPSTDSTAVTKRVFLKAPPGERPSRPPPIFDEDYVQSMKSYLNFPSRVGAMTPKPLVKTTEATRNDQPVVDSYKQREKGTSGTLRKKAGTNNKRLRKNQAKKAKKLNKMMDMLIEMSKRNSMRKKKKAARSVQRRKNGTKVRAKKSKVKQNTVVLFK